MSEITDYIASAPLPAQERLQELYALLKELLPEAQEKISYQMPTFFHKQNILHFAANKNHLGLYPTPGPIAHFAVELAPYKTSKGAIQFPYDKPLPTSLISKIVAYRLEEIQ